MDKLQTGTILAKLQVAYPSFYRNVTQKDAMAAVNLWQEMFEDETFETVNAAVKALIATRSEGYPPTIGEVKGKIADLAGEQDLSPLEAWNLVERACANGIYESKEEFEKLPPLAQKAVGTPNQLREWALMDPETLKSVVASNFQRSFRVIQKREKEIGMIPESVRAALAETTSGLKMLWGKTNDD